MKRILACALLASASAICIGGSVLCFSDFINPEQLNAATRAAEVIARSAIPLFAEKNKKREEDSNKKV